MNPQSKYILFFSDKCVHSREFLNQLYKNQPFYRKMIKIDVGNTEMNIPKCITAVPAIIIKTPRMKPQVFIGDEVFIWYNRLQSQIEKASQSNQSAPPSGQIGSIADYDPCAMSGFSDNFSYLDENGMGGSGLLAHQFEFLDGSSVTGPLPPMGANFQDPTDKKDGSKKDALMQDYERLQAQRDRDMPKAPQRKGGDTDA